MSGRSGGASTLAELADLAEIRGAAATASDLRRAAAAVLAGTLTQEAAQSDLYELADGGRASDALRRALAGIPLLLRRLIQLPVLTAAEAVVLVGQGGVLTLADLRAALEGGRLETAIGASTVGRLRGAVTTLEQQSRPLPLGRAWDLLGAVVRQVASACPVIEDLTVAGDARRVEPLVGTLSLVGRAPDPPSALEAVRAMSGIDAVLHSGPRRTILLIQQVELDVRVATDEEYGTALFRSTGSPAHVAAVERRRATPRLARREEEVYAHAGLQYIPPELRHATGEIDAAAVNALPRLLSADDIRGDLHMHSTYSDGRDTLASMVAACSALGYEYMAITDHSERAGASRTVTRDQLARQGDEIARLRERHSGLAILHGLEVDVMPDGGLDFPDAVLEPLDIVIASVHDSARQDARRLTARCLQAIRHPLITILSHPANRIVGGRGGYPLDYPALYAAAAESGTALEIDGAPLHLDLDGAAARAAVAAGVTIVVNSDAHRAAGLARQMRFGVGTARRGWLEAPHVLNTRPLPEVRRFIQAKRHRR